MEALAALVQAVVVAARTPAAAAALVVAVARTPAAAGDTTNRLRELRSCGPN